MQSLQFKSRHLFSPWLLFAAQCARAGRSRTWMASPRCRAVSTRPTSSVTACLCSGGGCPSLSRTRRACRHTRRSGSALTPSAASTSVSFGGFLLADFDEEMFLVNHFFIETLLLDAREGVEVHKHPRLSQPWSVFFIGSFRGSSVSSEAPLVVPHCTVMASLLHMHSCAADAIATFSKCIKLIAFNC